MWSGREANAWRVFHIEVALYRLFLLRLVEAEVPKHLTIRNEPFPPTGLVNNFLWNAQDHNPSGSQRSIIGVVTRLRSGGSRKDVFLSPKRPNRFSGAPSLIFNVHWRPLPRVHSGRGVRMTTHLHLETRWKMCRAIPRRSACWVA